MRVINKDNSANFGGTPEINLSSLTTGDQLWSLKKKGTQLDLTLLQIDPDAPDISATNALTTGIYTSSGTWFLGARNANSPKSWTGGPIYSMVAYNRAVEAPSDIESVYNWFTTVRGLANV